MAKKNRPNTPAPNEFWPIELGHGPKLRFDDERFYVRLGVSQSDYPIGDEPDHATALVTYTSQITRDSKDSLTQEGETVTGWLLVDSEGQALARLASDEDEVYDREALIEFAHRAGLKFKDWGEISAKRIDTLLSQHREIAVPKALGATRREWIMVAAVVGGVCVAWPFIMNITFQGDRGKALVLFALGLSCFLAAGIGLGIGRWAARFSDKATMATSLIIGGVFLAASFYVRVAGITIWKLTAGMTGSFVLGLAILAVVVPFWARTNRTGEAELVHRTAGPVG